MTVSMLQDRLERFRQGVLQYREMSQEGILHSRNGTDFLDTPAREALRDKLRQQFSDLDEYLKVFSRGRYQIHVDSSDLQDIYTQGFSEGCREWHLDIILSDLQQMLAELRKQPLHQHVTLQNRWQMSRGANPQFSFGSLGHLGHSLTPSKPASLHAVLNMVAHILDQRIESPEDKKALQSHLHAIVEHPDMARLLPLSPSELL